MRSCRGWGDTGFTLVELLIVMTLVGLLASIGVAVYRDARKNAQEASAIATLQTINRAQFGFAQTCGNQRYAPTLTALGTPAPTTGQPFLSPDLTLADSVQKSGYQFTMAGTAAEDEQLTCIGVRGVTSYQVTADPINQRAADPAAQVTPDAAAVPQGSRFFATNTDRALFADTVTFTGNMPETGAPGHGEEIR